MQVASKLIALSLVVGTSLAAQSTLVVSAGGPFTTLSAAVAASVPGEAVRVVPGTYNDPSVIIDKGITVLGTPGSTTINTLVIRGFTI